MCSSFFLADQLGQLGHVGQVIWWFGLWQSVEGNLGRRRRRGMTGWRLKAVGHKFIGKIQRWPTFSPRIVAILGRVLGVNVGAGDGAGAGGPLVAVRARHFAGHNGWNQFQNRGLVRRGGRLIKPAGGYPLGG